MTFEEAIDRMKHGYKVRRKIWYEEYSIDDYLHMQKLDIKWLLKKGNSPVTPNITGHDVTATDWEVYDETN